jgi:hypothetical protein
MANLLSPPAEAERPAAAPAGNGLLLVAGADPVLADFAAFAGRDGARAVAVLAPGRLATLRRSVAAPRFCEASLTNQGPRASAGVVVFLGRGLGRTEREVTDAAAECAAALAAERVILVSTFRVHFGDRQAASAEAHALERFRRPGVKVTVVRPAPVLSPHSRARALLRALGFCYPLVPRRRTGCCVDGAELFAALEQELSRPDPRDGAAYTLLGPNRPWRDRLREHQPDKPTQARQ